MPMSAKLQVVQAYDRAPIAEIDTDDAAALELKLATATQAFRDRNGWLPVHQRVDVLRRVWPL
jgi:acyl-CoA reductase-like NAD-dependent aldehyde dehydrogenase